MQLPVRDGARGLEGARRRRFARGQLFRVQNRMRHAEFVRFGTGSPTITIA